MNSASRKSLLRQIKHLKWHKESSTVAVANNKNDFIIRSPLSDVKIPDISFFDRFWRDSKAFLNHTAIECIETKKSYTYKQVKSCMSTFATSLHKKLGLNVGDVVAVMLPNCPEFPVVAFGTIQAGCILTTINPIYKEFEVTHQFKTTRPKVIISTTECYNIIKRSMDDANITAKIVVIDRPNNPVPDNTIRYSEIAENNDVDYQLLSKIVRNKDDTACIPFSSGTTGLPKGVELTQYTYLAAMETLSHEKICFPQLASENFQEVVPSILPFFHVYGMMIVMLAHMTLGCKMVTMTKFSSSLYLDILKNQKSTLLYVVPPIVTLLSKHPDVTFDHLKHVKHLSCGAAPLSASDVEPLLEKSKDKIHIGQGFGATETAAVATGTPKDMKPDYSAAGVPMSNVELMFVNHQTGEPVPIGEEGELYIRGPTVMKGYYNNAEATKDSLTEDGFFKTGDMGHYTPGAGLFISDRIKELIKVKGMQVAPAELESLLRSHPSIADAAVIGIPHDIYGECPKAFVILKRGSELSSKDIQDFVASKVAPYKKVEEVQFVDQIPKTVSGKIMRRELKAMYG